MIKFKITSTDFKAIFVLIICFFLSGTLYSQNYFKQRFWTNDVPNGGYQGKHINETSSGEFIMEAYIGSTTDHGLLIKTDSYGNLLFYKSYWKTGYNYDDLRFLDLIVTNDDSYLVAGRIAMNPVPGTTGLLARIAQDGSVVWSKRFNSPFTIPEGILKMEDGTYVLRIDNQSHWIILCNTDDFGNLTNSASFNDTTGSSPDIRKQIPLPSNKIALAGMSGTDAYILLLDSTREVVFSNRYPGCNGITEIIQTHDSGFLCVTHDGGQVDTTFSLMKTDSLGIPEWVTTFSGATRMMVGGALIENSDHTYYCGFQWYDYNVPSQIYGGGVVKIDSVGNLLGINDSLEIAFFRQFKYTSDNRLCAVVDDWTAYFTAPSLLITDSLFTLGSGLCLNTISTPMLQAFSLVSAVSVPITKSNYQLNTTPVSLHDSLDACSLLTCIQSENGCINSSSSISVASCGSFVSPSGLYTWTSSGLYKDTIPNAIGCDSIINIYLTIFPSVNPVILGDSLICQGDSTILTISSPFVSYLWSTAAIDPGITINTTGVYTVTVTDQNGCTGTTSIDVQVLQYPVISISAQSQTTFCQGDSVILSASPGLTYYQWYRWNTAISGATSMNFTAKTRGKYKCIAQNAALCADTSNIIPVNVPCITPVDEAEKNSGSGITNDQFTFEAFYDLTSENLNMSASNVNGTNYTIVVFDQAGKLILNEKGSLTNKEFSKQLDFSPYANGIYVVRFTTEIEQSVEKFWK